MAVWLRGRPYFMCGLVGKHTAVHSHLIQFNCNTFYFIQTLNSLVAADVDLSPSSRKMFSTCEIPMYMNYLGIRVIVYILLQNYDCPLYICKSTHYFLLIFYIPLLEDVQEKAL